MSESCKDCPLLIEARAILAHDSIVGGGVPNHFTAVECNEIEIRSQTCEGPIITTETKVLPLAGLRRLLGLQHTKELPSFECSQYVVW